MTLDRFLKGISGKMNIDGNKAYTLNAQLKKERVKNAHKYSPSLEITLPNKQPYTVSGMFMYDGIRKFDVELDMNRITAKPVKASGNGKFLKFLTDISWQTINTQIKLLF